ncbi:SET domain-containing protein [Meira miltonrushii]|uniref:SET domain-containing protein n=1 Tax=Meira miltonrushii TaxID=1280837 RepID=A0A316VHL0_9BASI|nr:SET domain-containing protein [Meira miltonrushii]PWN36734.1 SET domain-containing protein [Meira miltonrushii]
MGLKDDEELCERYNTLDALCIREGQFGRGLFVRNDVIEGETLLVLPPSCLLNSSNADRFVPKELIPSTTKPSHPSHWEAGETRLLDGKQCSLPLTSVQVLTLILALWKAGQRVEKQTPKDKREEESHKYLDLFLGTYPTSFSSLPLTWQVYVQHNESNAEFTPNETTLLLQTMLDHLPAHIKAQAQKVQLRFDRDVRAIQAVQLSRPDLLDQCMNGHVYSSITMQDWVWAWACVNSRCVYLPLGLKPHGDNFTLAPLLDMANHTMETEKESKVRWLPSKALQINAPKNGKGQLQGEEIFISYGPHSNGFLLTEYGFTIPSTLSNDLSEWKGNRYSEVHVDHIILGILEKQGNQGKAKIEMLEEQGYWGEYTIHPFPSPAHPSYRLVLAARLIAVDLHDNELNCLEKNGEIKAWHQNVQGIRDNINPKNEERMHALLAGLCHLVCQDADQHIKAIKGSIPQLSPSHSQFPEEEAISSANNLIALHEEESHIARMLIQAIDSGQTDW